VRPSSCQPPGVAVGYTEANPPATATEPAGTDGRGVDRRDTEASSGGRPTR
jgi:hypothetical protein